MNIHGYKKKKKEIADIISREENSKHPNALRIRVLEKAKRNCNRKILELKAKKPQNKRAFRKVKKNKK